MSQLVYLRNGTAQVWHETPLDGGGSAAVVPVEVYELDFVESHLPLSILVRLYPKKNDEV